MKSVIMKTDKEILDFVHHITYLKKETQNVTNLKCSQTYESLSKEGGSHSFFYYFDASEFVAKNVIGLVNINLLNKPVDSVDGSRWLIYISIYKSKTSIFREFYVAHFDISRDGKSDPFHKFYLKSKTLESLFGDIRNVLFGGIGTISREIP